MQYETIITNAHMHINDFSDLHATYMKCTGSGPSESDAQAEGQETSRTVLTQFTLFPTYGITMG